MIHHMLFDLGQVLVPFDRKRSYHRLLPHLSPEKREFVTLHRNDFEALIEQPAVDLETGRIDFKYFQEQVERVIETSLSTEEFRRIWCDIFWIDEEIVALGEFLSKRYGTWLVSNTSRAHYEWILEKFPRVVFYRDAALSYELGVMKPEKEYYQKALAQFRVDPAHCVFIDDLKENVDGAVAAGMSGIVFTHGAQLVEALKELGVECFPEDIAH
jgi:putative hydrolase of the HAD superfamily